MSPHTIGITDEQRAYQESHRCAVCNGVPVRISSEMVEEHRVLKPTYRHMAILPMAAVEPYMTELVASEWRTETECENGHVLSGRHWKNHT